MFAIIMLKEDGLRLEHVEGASVRQFHCLEGGLLGEDLIDDGVKEWVG
jgi:hypothetical protein